MFFTTTNYMTEILRKKLNESKAMRWTVLCFVAFTMFCTYMITDLLAPMMEQLEQGFGWSASEVGLFHSSYVWINVFLFVLILGGMILDKIGTRITGVASCLMMIIGCAIKYYAIANPDHFVGTFLGVKSQVITTCIGFAIFGCGAEMAGITVTKVIVRWFTGYEIALALGLQVAVARIGTALAMSTAIPISNYFGSVSAPLLIGLFGLCIGLISYLVFCVMDKKLDETIDESGNTEEPFKLKDIFLVASNKGFWLLSILCVLFYSAVFPFLKYATSLMMNKYHVESELAGLIPALLPFGTIFLTPLFGYIYDKKGKGTTIMIAGAVLLIVVHALFAAAILNVWWFATILMILLGIAFAMVPSAMWPSVPKIIPQNQLGTAYGLIFWTQNIGLGGVPYLIGWILEKYCITGTTADGITMYDYTLPMIIFALFGVSALIVAYLLKIEDKKKGYGLQEPNITA